MRIGENPAKSEAAVRSDARFRVVVPVYIPDLDGYFAAAAEVLELCLDSLRRTTGSETRVTVVANGCHPTVVERLQARYDATEVDQLIVSRDNLGKVDGFLAGARGSWEEVVLVSDADVLWREGWPAALFAILAAFPECGVVCASPAPNLVGYATATTVLDAVRRRELARAAVVDLADLERFAASVGSPDLFAGWEDEQFVVRRHGVTALVGGGHFACAFRRDALASVPTAPCTAWERDWLDVPPDAAGWWRLATPRAYALHLGNAVEPWMAAELAALPMPGPDRLTLPAIDRGRPSPTRHVPMAVRARVAERRLRSARGPGRSTPPPAAAP